MENERIKLLGGDYDGDTITILKGERWVKLAKRLPLPTVTWKEPEVQAQPVEYESDLYTRRRFRWNDGRVLELMVLEGIADDDALAMIDAAKAL